MKINFKSMMLGVILGASVTSVVSVGASEGVRNIEAVFKNIQIYVDGNKITPRDSAGKEIEPFIYNGSTYLPLRAVGEAVGKEVSWDGATSSVYLGKSGMRAYLGQQVTKYQGSAREETVTMAGNQYVNGLDLYSSRDAYYNLNSMYSYVTGVYGMADGTDEYCEGTVSFYGDGKLLETLMFKGGELPKSFGFSVTGVTQLKIEADGHSDKVLGNVEFQ